MCFWRVTIQNSLLMFLKWVIIILLLNGWCFTIILIICDNVFNYIQLNICREQQKVRVYTWQKIFINLKCLNEKYIVNFIFNYLWVINIFFSLKYWTKHIYVIYEQLFVYIIQDSFLYTCIYVIYTYMFICYI